MTERVTDQSNAAAERSFHAPDDDAPRTSGPIVKKGGATQPRIAIDIRDVRNAIADLTARYEAAVQAAFACFKAAFEEGYKKGHADGFKAGGEDALLHALHPEFGSIYDTDGEATKLAAQAREEALEWAAMQARMQAIGYKENGLAQSALGAFEAERAIRRGMAPKPPSETA